MASIAEETRSRMAKRRCKKLKEDLYWGPEVTFVVRSWAGVFTLFSLILRAVLPPIGTWVLSTVTPGDDDKCSPQPCQFRVGPFVGGTILLSGPLLDKLVFRLLDPAWPPGVGWGPDKTTAVNMAASSLSVGAESLIGVIGSVIATNFVFKLQSGVVPVICLVVGPSVSVILIFLSDLWMLWKARRKHVPRYYREGDVTKAEECLKPIICKARFYFGLAGFLGLGSTVAAAVTSVTQFPDDDSEAKRNFLIRSFVPALTGLFVLASSLLEFTLRVHRAASVFIKAKWLPRHW